MAVARSITDLAAELEPRVEGRTEGRVKRVSRQPARPVLEVIVALAAWRYCWRRWVSFRQAVFDTENRGFPWTRSG